MDGTSRYSGGMMDALSGVIVLSILFSVAVPVAIIVVIVWAIRRFLQTRRDPAEGALRERLARGEIDVPEFQARLDALRARDGA